MPLRAAFGEAGIAAVPPLPVAAPVPGPVGCVYCAYAVPIASSVAAIAVTMGRVWKLFMRLSPDEGEKGDSRQATVQHRCHRESRRSPYDDGIAGPRRVQPWPARKARSFIADGATPSAAENDADGERPSDAASTRDRARRPRVM